MCLLFPRSLVMHTHLSVGQAFILTRAPKHKKSQRAAKQLKSYNTSPTNLPVFSPLPTSEFNWSEVNVKCFHSPLTVPSSCTVEFEPFSVPVGSVRKKFLGEPTSLLAEGHALGKNLDQDTFSHQPSMVDNFITFLHDLCCQAK